MNDRAEEVWEQIINIKAENQEQLEDMQLNILAVALAQAEREAIEEMLYLAIEILNRMYPGMLPSVINKYKRKADKLIKELEK